MAEYPIGQRYLGSGVIMPGIAGETIPRGATVFMSAVDGLWYLADSDAAATLPAVGIVSDAGPAGQIIQILVLGLIERSDWTWTRGDTLYTSGVAGVMAQVAPANAQPVAVAITATLIYVNTTLSVVGGAAAAGEQDMFYEAPDPDDFKGTYASMLLTDGQSTLIRQTFYLPANYDTDWSVDVIVIPDATGNLRWGVATNFAEICNDEDYQTHTDSIALAQSAVTADEVECLDITAALTGALAGDLVGIEFTRDGGNVLDTVNDQVHYIGIVLRAPPAP